MLAGNLTKVSVRLALLLGLYRNQSSAESPKLSYPVRTKLKVNAMPPQVWQEGDGDGTSSRESKMKLYDIRPQHSDEFLKGEAVLPPKLVLLSDYHLTRLALSSIDAATLSALSGGFHEIRYPALVKEA